MKEGLLQLLQLQAVDKEVFTLEEAKEKYPTEISERQREIENAQAHLIDLEATLEELGKKQRHCEREIESDKVNLKEHEERFAVVTTNKEYDALQTEIEACKSSLSENESELLDAIEGIERVQGQIGEEKTTFEEIRQTQQERIDELQSQLNTMQEQVDEVQKRRKKVAKDIEARLLATYERKKGRRGVRVAAVRKGACGGCFHQMPAQIRMEVRSGERGVLYCESCGTIMAWDEQSD
jgi:predicted  nucleic acid-binding Zn-ribbon protein